MSFDFEVTWRLRLTVDDPDAPLRGAGDAVPVALGGDPDVALQMALQAVVPAPAVD
jgi:hypothetical protein